MKQKSVYIKMKHKIILSHWVSTWSHIYSCFVPLLSADIRSLTDSTEVLPEQQEMRPNLDQESPCIKEEQEEVWNSQEGEQLQGLEEADITLIPVKSEDDDEDDHRSIKTKLQSTEK